MAGGGCSGHPQPQTGALGRGGTLGCCSWSTGDIGLAPPAPSGCPHQALARSIHSFFQTSPLCPSLSLTPLFPPFLSLNLWVCFSPSSSKFFLHHPLPVSPLSFEPSSLVNPKKCGLAELLRVFTTQVPRAGFLTLLSVCVFDTPCLWPCSSPGLCLLPEFGVFVDSYGRRSRTDDLKWSRLPLAFGR